MIAASLVVGIQDYDHVNYRGSHNRLRYAVTDAGAFNAYARAALGTTSDEHHQLLTDRGATAAAIDQAATKLAHLGRFDLLLVYLSGHGDRGATGRGWFCLADAKPGSPSLDAALLDRLLGPIEAATIMVFIDCCYAEAILIGKRPVRRVRPRASPLRSLFSPRRPARVGGRQTQAKRVFAFLAQFALGHLADLEHERACRRRHRVVPLPPRPGVAVDFRE